jgi:glycosyltransferase involved in cell wall biosynthesis
MKAISARMAMLLSLSSFEEFYGGTLQLTCDEYLTSYRNDFSFMYARALAALGVEVTLYVPSWECKGLHPIEDLIRVRFLPIAPWFKLWERFRILGKTPVGRYAAQYANVKAFESPLLEALAEDRVDALYVQEYWTARFDYLARTIPLRVIGSDHGARRYRQLTLFKKTAFRAAYAVTSQTVDECEQVRDFGKEAVLLSNGVDIDFYTPSSSAVKAQTILTVGRLVDRQKRTSDLIRALPFLPEPWSLQIAGEGQDGAMLRELVGTLGLEKRVVFLGFVTDKAALREMYRTSGVFCLPSAYEGLPLVALEAMSCASAVVVTSIRAFESLVEDEVSGYKAPVGDPKRLAEAIAMAWQERERIGRAARGMVETKYSLRAMAHRLLRLIKDPDTLPTL